jgi:hypothetical protein
MSGWDIVPFRRAHYVKGRYECLLSQGQTHELDSFGCEQDMPSVLATSETSTRLSIEDFASGSSHLPVFHDYGFLELEGKEPQAQVRTSRKQLR